MTTAKGSGKRGPGSATAGEGKSCPTCGKPAVATYRPFCSRRCADVDLGRWLKGDYRIPAVEPPDGFDEADIPPPGRGGEDGRE